MADWLGDFSTGSTVFFRFTTVASSGPAVAFSSGGLTVYQDGSTVPNTTGLTLTSTFAGRTGLNSVQIDMAGTSTFYQPGSQYSAVVSSGGTSDASLAGYVLREWSIKRGVPTDWGAVFNATTAAVLSGTSFASTTQVLLSSSAISTAVFTSSAAAYLGLSAAIAMTVGTGETYAGAATDSVIKLIKEGTISALSSDSYEHPTTPPSSAASIMDMVRYPYSGLRHRIDVGSSFKTFYSATTGVLFVKALTQDSTSSTGVYTESVASTST